MKSDEHCFNLRHNVQSTKQKFNEWNLFGNKNFLFRGTFKILRFVIFFHSNNLLNYYLDQTFKVFFQNLIQINWFKIHKSGCSSKYFVWITFFMKKTIGMKIGSIQWILFTFGKGKQVIYSERMYLLFERKKNQTVQLPVRAENCIRTNKEECTQPLNMDILMHICKHVVG